MPAKEGNKAPAFNLESSLGGKVALKDLAGTTVVLYFYPKDSTPGCTLEANDFQAAAAKFKRIGAQVYGVSRDSIESHCRFSDKQGLKFALLSDPDHKVHDKYGAWGEKKLYGKTSIGAIRTTAVIRPDGRIHKFFSKVKVKGHVDAVLESVRELNKSS